MPAVLRLDDLGPYLLLRNGNYLYKVPFRGGWAVLKVYHGSRPAWRYVTGTLGNWLVAGQTSFMPRARRRTELACLRLWRRHGFRVFHVYDDVVVEAPGLRPDGYALFEYAPGRRFVELFADPAVPVAEKRALYRRFLREWHRRHALALRLREPRLVHENGDLKHVMLYRNELLWFDFEMCYRSRRRVREFVAREILAYLKSLGKTVGAAAFPDYLADTVRYYPDGELLAYAHTYMHRHPNPLRRLGRWLDYRLKRRPRKPFSKHHVALALRAALGDSRRWR